MTRSTRLAMICGSVRANRFCDTTADRTSARHGQPYGDAA